MTHISKTVVSILSFIGTIDAIESTFSPYKDMFTNV